MNTNTADKFYGLDHLRAFAISFVFLFHYPVISSVEPEWLPALTTFGWTGVDLFFVLSGFLISYQLFSQVSRGQKISWKEFFIKRSLRILPLFFVVVSIYFCLPFFREKEALPPIWKFLTFTQNIGLDLKNFGTFSHAWSLCVEEHFYLLLPIILIVAEYLKVFKRAYWLIVVLFLFGFAIRMYSFNNVYLPQIEVENNWIYWYKYVYYPTYNRLDALLIGVAIAAMYQFLPTTWSRISSYGNHAIVISVLVLTIGYLLCEDAHSFYASVFGFPLIAAGYGFMVVGAISPTSFLYKWKSKTTTYLAALSYPIYLTHKGIIHMTHQILDGFKIDGNLMLIICITTCILGALLLDLTIGKPFMRLRTKLIPTNQPLVQAT